MKKMDLCKLVTFTSKIIWLENNIEWSEGVITHLRRLNRQWKDKRDRLLQQAKTKKKDG